MAECQQDASRPPFSNPVYKKISEKNGKINKMTYKQLTNLAKKLKINSQGTFEILRKRLKTHYRTLYLKEHSLKWQQIPYDYYIIIDFEATCQDDFVPRKQYPHEIIEFPAVVVNTKTYSIDHVFHEYVKPVVNKTLSDFCISLTGISQKEIDSADTFPCVLKRFEEWLQKHGLSSQSAIVTDGPWDMARFLYLQLKLSKLPYPKFAKQWVNIKKSYSNFYKQRKPTLDVMLQQLNFEFEGRRHNGLDDSRNIAKVLIQMLKDGACVLVNERIDLSSFQSHTCSPISQIVKPVTVEDHNSCMYAEKVPLDCVEDQELGDVEEATQANAQTEDSIQKKEALSDISSKESSNVNKKVQIDISPETGEKLQDISSSSIESSITALSSLHLDEKYGGHNAA